MTTYVIIIVSALFAIGIFVRQHTSKKICAICFSILSTWLFLLGVQKFGSYNNNLLIGLLMGQSVAGFYYYARGKLPKIYRIFTLPYFLSTTFLGILLLTEELTDKWTPLAILTIWIVALIIYVDRNDPATKAVANGLMDCCNDK